ncbi:hypothetical protein LZ554_001902 [Drepanopeziza brunnea f. sp. 'monogermtubi']|nr:hypothetical protein LZ554_001902 [Drepanopeziza brunnea f. sp. 'monogermtubi']
MLSPLQWKPSTNRTRKKSKGGGCKVCKLRKIRCGEEKPSCANCKIYYCDRIQRCQYGDRTEVPPARKLRLVPTRPPVRNIGFFISHDEESSRLPPHRSRLPSIVGSGNVDMFGIHPVRKLPDVDELLCYYVSLLVVKQTKARLYAIGGR